MHISKYAKKANYQVEKRNVHENQLNMAKRFHLSFEEFKKLKKYCDKKKIEFLSTPFDDDSVDFLNKLVRFFKIASADINNLPLLEKIGSKKKPVIISTGASNIKEIEFALKILKKKGVKQVCIMHCILNYPTKKVNANLKMISFLAKKFPNQVIGYSDHTLPDPAMTNLTSAYLLGAKIIEKHFTNNKNLKGNDHYHSMDKENLMKFKKKVSSINKLLGNYKEKTIIPTERISRLNARRSIVAIKDIKKGTKLSKSDLICKRPGTGISPIFWYKIIGKKAKKNIKSDKLISWSDLY